MKRKNAQSYIRTDMLFFLCKTWYPVNFLNRVGKYSDPLHRQIPQLSALRLLHKCVCVMRYVYL